MSMRRESAATTYLGDKLLTLVLSALAGGGDAEEVMQPSKPDWEGSLGRANTAVAYGTLIGQLRPSRPFRGQFRGHYRRRGAAQAGSELNFADGGKLVPHTGF